MLTYASCVCDATQLFPNRPGAPNYGCDCHDQLCSDTKGACFQAGEECTIRCFCSGFDENKFELKSWEHATTAMKIGKIRTRRTGSTFVRTSTTASAIRSRRAWTPSTRSKSTRSVLRSTSRASVNSWMSSKAPGSSITCSVQFSQYLQTYHQMYGKAALAPILY